MSSRSRNLGLRNLGLNAGRTLVAQVTTIALGLALSILLARGLGPEANGLYALALLLPTTLATMLNMGLVPANVYHVGRGDLSARQALRASFRAWFVLSIVGLIIAPTIVLLRGEQWFPGVPTTLMVLALTSFPVMLLHSYMVSLLHGLQDFKKYNSLLIVTPSVTFALSAIAILALKVGVLGAVAAHVAGQLVSLGVAWRLLAPHLARSEDEPADEVGAYIRRSISYGWKAHLSNILAFINYRVDVFLTNLFLSPALVGIYYVAIQIAERMWIIAQVVSVVMLPKLSELHSDEERRRALTPIVTRLVLLATVAVSAVLAAIAKPLVVLLFGTAFEQAHAALLWLLPGVVAGSVAKVVANDFAARGRPLTNSALSAVVIVVNVIANVILIPRLGIVGAGIATSISYGVHALATLVIYARFSGTSLAVMLVPRAEDAGLIREGLAALAAGVRRRGDR